MVLAKVFFRQWIHTRKSTYCTFIIPCRIIIEVQFVHLIQFLAVVFVRLLIRSGGSGKENQKGNNDFSESMFRWHSLPHDYYLNGQSDNNNILLLLYILRQPVCALRFHFRKSYCLHNRLSLIGSTPSY